VRDGEAVSNLDLDAIFGTDAQESADNSGGLCVADISPDRMIEDREDGLARSLAKGV
jgi:hypothetical protein